MVVGVGEVKACVSGGTMTQLANYQNNFGRPEAAIRFSFSPYFYPLQGVCSYNYGCRYDETSDRLFEFSGSGPSLAVYDQLTKRMQLAVSAERLVFTVDTTDRYYPFSVNGTNLRITSFAISDNGRWLAAELRYKGIAIADLTDGTARQVEYFGDLYNRGFNPIMELDVSDDGQHIAVVGINTKVRVYDITSECLLPLENALDTGCPSTHLWLHERTDSYKWARMPQFLQDGELLSVQLVSQTAPVKTALLSIGQRPHTPMAYVALGDSYSSGEGETDSRHYSSESSDCRVSDRSYPFLLQIDTTISVACSGATTADIIGGAHYQGQTPTKQQTVNEAHALAEAVPGIIAQSEFLTYHQPRIATVGIGGNDAGFMSKLRTCAGPGVCDWAYPERLSITALEIDALYDRLVSLYQFLHAAAPQTQLFAVSYPQIIADTERCGGEVGILFSSQERRYMYESIRYVNQIIRAAAATSEVTYLDSEAAYGAHQLCSKTSTPAVNGVRFGTDSAVISWLPTLKIISGASFHPTPYGHELVAQSITANYGNLLDYQPCNCEEVTTREPPPYWQMEDSALVPRYAYVATLANYNQNEIAITIPPGLFPAYTKITLEAHSDPIALGTYDTDDDGGLSVTVATSALSPGYHSIRANGQALDDRTLTIYNNIRVSPELPTAELSAEKQAISEPSSEEISYNASFLSPTQPTDTSTVSTGDILGAATAATVQKKLTPHYVWLFWMIVVLVFMIIVWSTWRLYAYNGTMNIRTVVKKIIPKQLFKKIEPIGHLFEAVLMNILYGFPAKKMRIIGVTGTNGKTTTSFMIHRLLHESGVKVGLLTTVAHGIGDDIILQKVHMTTVQSGVLNRRLKEFATAGVEWVVVETSSHALAQNRVWGLPYEISVMTNITHEHLDYHGTFERYVEAKRRLFKITNKHGMKFGAVNAQDPSAERFVKTVDNSTTYGIGAGQLSASKVSLTSSGSHYTARIDDDSYDISVNIPGKFNVSNSLAAIAVGRQLGLSTTQIEKGIAALTAVEGRINVIDEGQTFKVIVDFASTPDAFTNFFESIRPLTKGKLIAVFGSAGRRDEAKRSVQGKIAGKYADTIVITEEDNRDVDGEHIMQEIASGVKKVKKFSENNLFMIENREEAIGFAMTQATSKDDVVVLLGKGHEQTIERADGEYPWNEAEVARAALQALKTTR